MRYNDLVKRERTKGLGRFRKVSKTNQKKKHSISPSFHTHLYLKFSIKVVEYAK